MNIHPRTNSPLNFKQLRALPSQEKIPADEIPQEQYEAAFAAKGAAYGSVVGYAAKLLVSSVVEYGKTLLIATPIVGGPIAAGAALAAGILKGVRGDIKSKGTKGAKQGIMAGGFLAGRLAPLAKKWGVSLNARTLEMGKDFKLKEALGRIRHFNYSSLPRVSEDEAEQFKNSLKPGDIILTKNYSSHGLSFVNNIPGIKQHFNRALIYKGDGEAYEALTGGDSRDAKSDTGVSVVKLDGHLEKQHHVTAIRTTIQPQQVESLFAEAENYKSSTKNVVLRYTNDTFFASQFVDTIFDKAAPQVKFRKYPKFKKDVLFMDDLAKGKENSIVAEAGSAHREIDIAMSKFC